MVRPAFARGEARLASLCATCALLCLLDGGCAHGPRPGPPIDEVRFRGNASLSSRRIASKIQLQSTSWLLFRARQYLEPLALEVDKKRIEALYHEEGFFSARVKEVRVEPAGGGSDAVEVIFDLEEGPRTFVRSLEVVGLDGLAAEQRVKVLHELPLVASAPFVHDRYLESKQLVAARLRQLGYAWAEVTGEARVDRDARAASVTIAARPGPLARFGRVTVKGDDDDARAIARRSAIREGERFSPEPLEATRERLLGTGRFAGVQVRAVPREGDPAIADVAIAVQPGLRNEVKVGVGFGLDFDREELHVPLHYSRYGVFGGLRSLALSAKLAYVTLPSIIDRERQGPAGNVDLLFTQPDFLARDLTLRVGVGYDLGVDYAFRFHGPRGLAGLERTFLRDRVSIAGSYNFQYVFFWDLAAADVFDNPDEARNFLGYTNPYRLAFFVEQITFDFRDDRLDARRGLYVRLGFEEGQRYFGSDFDYEKVVPDVRGYVPLGRRVVLSARVLAGWLFTQDPSSPITRRFYLGGSESHRGFGYERLAPQIASPTTSFAIPIGGDRELLIQGEARLDVARIYGNWLGLAAFVDAGDVSQRGYSIDLTQLHVAVGPGLRYRTIIGTIRADFGVRLNRLAPTQPDGRQNPDPGDRFAFHLSVGEAF